MHRVEPKYSPLLPTCSCETRSPSTLLITHLRSLCGRCGLPWRQTLNQALIPNFRGRSRFRPQLRCTSSCYHLRLLPASRQYRQPNQRKQDLSDDIWRLAIDARAQAQDLLRHLEYGRQKMLRAPVIGRRVRRVLVVIQPERCARSACS